MKRTYGAALVAAVVVGATLIGLGVYLGFPVGPSAGFGVVCGLLAGLLLVGASRRADTFHPTDPNAHLADHSDVGDHLDAGSAAQGPAEDDTDDPPAGASRG
jgi:hypothetical protein